MKKEKYLTPKEALEVLNSGFVAIAMNKDGDWNYFKETPNVAINGCWVGVGNTPLPFNIKYDGDWKDSLTVREKPFEITETGLYNMKNGNKVFIHFLGDTVLGVIINERISCKTVHEWHKDGTMWGLTKESVFNIISKWAEE